MTDHHLTIFVPGEDRLSTKLRAAHTNGSPMKPVPSADASGGPRDPRTRFLLNNLYHRAFTTGLCYGRDAFLLLVGKTLAQVLPERSTTEPALTLSNLLLVERVLFLQSGFDQMLPEKVAVYNQALDLIYSEEVSPSVKQFARNVADALSDDLSPRNGVCGCGHPLHLRLDCPQHGGIRS